MFKRASIFALAFWVASPVLLAGQPLKIMTFNIRYDGGAHSLRESETPWAATQGPQRRDWVLDVIEQVNPDLLGLQEVLPNQLQDVRTRLTEYSSYSVGRDDGEQVGEHCAIFYRTNRFEAIDEGTFWLCATPDEPGAKHPEAACPRIASWVKLRDHKNANRELMVLNTHWDHVGKSAREFAAEAIVDYLVKTESAGKAIVMGDLNTRPGSKAFELLTGEPQLPLVDCYRAVHPEVQQDEATGNGFVNRTRGERIDYVVASPELMPTSAEIVRTTFEGKNPSDHYPVVVEFATAEE